MNTLNKCADRVRQYCKSRTATLIFYKIKKLCDEEFSTSEVYTFVRIKDFCSLERFSIAHNNSLVHLLNEDCKKRFKNGSLIFIAMIDTEWVSYGWLAIENEFWIAEIDCIVDITSSKIGILFDFFTRENMRGRGIYPILIRYITQYHAAPYNLIYCYDNNNASMRGIEKSGGKPDIKLYHSDRKINDYFAKNSIRIVGSKYRCLGLKYAK